MAVLTSKKARIEKSPALGVGETWHVLLPVSNQCATVTIDEVTEATVVLSLERDCGCYYAGHLGRYKRSQIEFVERIPG